MIHQVISSVTARIRERSAARRQAFLARIQRHLPAFQQGNYPIDAGKRGKFAVAGDSCDTGAPVKIARCGREAANLTRFASTIAPEADRHLTDIKELHHHS